jgi:hypothetical protein
LTLCPSASEIKVTFCRLGRNVRLVLLLAWETLLPTCRPLPVSSQTRDMEPCAMCAGAMALARLGRLYFAAGDPKGGAILHGPRLFSQPTCHHAPEVYHGMAEAEAGELLRAFFRERRGG